MNMECPDVPIPSSPDPGIRQKRSKLMSPSASKPKNSSSGRKGDPGGPKITRPCSECGKTFWSWKALFGHMRCHPERQWRGINPPSTPISLEDHQVAHSLLLLANSPSPKPLNVVEVEVIEEDQERSRFECSSCKKVFSSHQALGGHRASHKNVKGCFAITRSTESEIDHDLITTATHHQYDHHPNQAGLLTLTRSSTITTTHDHMCSICLRVFSSGQALGGHKRCHWEEPSVNHGYAYGYGYGYANSTAGFDLNLPPPHPEDDHTAVTSSSGGSYSSGLTLDLRLRL